MAPGETMADLEQFGSKEELRDHLGDLIHALRSHNPCTTRRSRDRAVPRLSRKGEPFSDARCEVASVFSSRFCVDWYLSAGWIFAVKGEMPVGENAITGILIGWTRKYRNGRDADKGKRECPL
ncbi:hypothetical protein Y032_0081g1488 [Ancylostoma ceylanicum]|uniref:Uncharacterized protein n=1 Tax=Ancylostoma ceylanicum TaxID=53326 RepID=A0A016TTD0_9BILA|nr:hypothetical protein Y032_0081g1488 [Ancylostoma ceylanicum]